MLRSYLLADVAEGKPSSAYGYFDAMRVWLKRPLTRPQLAELAHHCGKGDKGGLHYENKRARFSSEYRQIIVARRPSEMALKLLSEWDDALVNGVEIALDSVWPSEREADAAFHFFHRHLVRRYHGKTQKTRFYGDAATDTTGTLYDGQRRHPNILTLYRSSYDRFTGEILPILHLEWRANGVEALKQAGLPDHLLDFDHRTFWEKRLLLADLNPERLGRYLRNRSLGRRARRFELNQVGRRTVNLNRRLGHLLLHKYDRLQELLDAHRRERVSRALRRLDNRAFLPLNGSKPNPNLRKAEKLTSLKALPSYGRNRLVYY
jgi:hypothetical protein